MLVYTMLYIVLAYLMLFAALTNSVCLNNASFFFLFKYFLCQGYELSGEIALKNNHYYYYYYYPTSIFQSLSLLPYTGLLGTLLTLTAHHLLLKFPVFQSFHLLKMQTSSVTFCALY